MSQSVEIEAHLPQSKQPPPTIWRPWQYLFCLTLAVVVVYWPGLPAPFIFDDQDQLERHPERRTLTPVTKFLYEMRPVGYVTFAINYSLHGLHPAGYRASNVLIHLGSVWLLFWIARHALKRRGNAAVFIRQANGLAFTMALLWGIHPLPTCAVTYVIQRFESLMSFFLLLSIAALWKGARCGRTHRAWPWFALAVVAAWLGAATKEVMVVAPMLLLLIDRAYLATSWQELFRQRWGVHLALLGCWAVIALTHYLGGSKGDYASAGFGGTVSSWEYLRSQPGVLLHYLQLVFWPDHLILDYAWPVATDPWAIYGLGSIIVALCLGSFWLWFTRPRIGIVALSFFLLLALTSTVLPIADLAFEYRMYLPTAPVVILAVLAGFCTLERLPLTFKTRENIQVALIVLLLTALGLRTYVRNKDYRDPVTIWKQCVDFNPNNGRANNNLAGRLGSLRRIDEAIPYYERTLLTDYAHLNDTRVNYGRDLMRAGRRKEAAVQFNAVLERPPTYVPIRMNLAEGLRELGRTAEAREHLEWILKKQPQYLDAQLKLTWILATSPEEEFRDPKRALKITQDLIAQHTNPTASILDASAVAYAANGDFERAIVLSNQAEQLARGTQPGYADVIAARTKLYESGKPFLSVKAEEDDSGPQTSQ